MSHYASGQGLQQMGWCLTPGSTENSEAGHNYGLFNFQAAKQVSSPCLTLHSQRRQTAAKPKPCTDNKKKKKSDADPNFPDCTGTLGSPGHLMVWTNPAVLGMMTAACAHHGCPWYNQLPLLWASTFPTASERAGAEQKMAQLIFSWKINRVALILRNVSGKTVTLFNTISSSLTDWKVVKAAI